MKITSGSVSCGGIIGTRIIILATRFAITIAEFTGFDEIVLAYRSTIVVVKTVAARCTTFIAMNAAGYINVRAKSIAGSCGAV